MATLGFCCCTQPFFSCSEWGLFFLQCTSFSLRWLLLFQSTGSKRGLHRLRHAGLVAPRHLGSSQTRYQTSVPSIVRWILSHWTIRKAPFFTILAPGSGYQFLQWVKKSVLPGVTGSQPINQRPDWTSLSTSLFLPFVSNGNRFFWGSECAGFQTGTWINCFASQAFDSNENYIIDMSESLVHWLPGELRASQPP